MARVLLIASDANDAHDVFELIELTDSVARVRSTYLYEVGEELQLRVEDASGATSDVAARVRAHSGPAAARVTELELSR